MRSWRFRTGACRAQTSGWSIPGGRGLLLLLLGYLLLYVVLFAEAAYVLPHLGPGTPGFDAEWFRAEWLRWSIGFGPLARFAFGPCWRLPYLSLTFFVPGVCLMARGYLDLLRWVQRHAPKRSLAFLLGTAALAAAPLLFLMPPTSGDYLAYIFAGRVLTVHHSNPWLHSITEFSSEWNYLSPTAWANLRCIYGPVWAAIMAGITGLVQLFAPGPITFGSLLLNLLLLRLANAVALGLAGVAIWRTSAQLGPRPQRLVTAAFLLNPLVVYEAIGACHNDVWGVAFLLWACCLFLRDDPRFILPLALSFLTKYVSIAMAPFLILYYWRRRAWRHLAWLGVGLVVSLAVLQLTSVHQVAGHLAPDRDQFYLTATSLPQFLAVLITRTWGLRALTGELVQGVSHGVMFLFAPLYLALVWRARTREQVVAHTLWAVGLFFTAVYVDTWPWYFVWPLGLLSVVRWSRATGIIACSSCLLLFSYVLQFWNHSGIRGWDVRVLLLAYLLAVGLPLLLSLAGRWGGWDLLGLSSTPESEPEAALEKPRPTPKRGTKLRSRYAAEER